MRPRRRRCSLELLRRRRARFVSLSSREERSDAAHPRALGLGFGAVRRECALGGGERDVAAALRLVIRELLEEVRRASVLRVPLLAERVEHAIASHVRERRRVARVLVDRDEDAELHEASPSPACTRGSPRARAPSLRRPPGDPPARRGAGRPRRDSRRRRRTSRERRRNLRARARGRPCSRARCRGSSSRRDRSGRPTRSCEASTWPSCSRWPRRPAAPSPRAPASR